MKYLRVRNFWDYQNADVWKKAQANKGGHRHPPWCKLHVARDFELDAQRPIVRLVFYELLRLATVHANAIPNDSQAIANAISMRSQDVSHALEKLLKGGWLSETRTPRSSRAPSRKFRQQKEIEKKKEKEILAGSQAVLSYAADAPPDEPSLPASKEPNGHGEPERMTADYLESIIEEARRMEQENAA